MALTGSGFARHHESLLTFYEVQFSKLHYLSFIDAGLEDEVEVGKKFSLREL